MFIQKLGHQGVALSLLRLKYPSRISGPATSAQPSNNEENSVKDSVCGYTGGLHKRKALTTLVGDEINCQLKSLIYLANVWP